MFHNHPFFPSPCWKHKDIYIFLITLVKLLKVDLTTLLAGRGRVDMTGFLWIFFNLILVHIEPPIICQLQFSFSYPQQWFPQCFLLFHLCLSKPQLPVCSIGGSDLPCFLLYLTESRRVVDFQSVQLFTYWQDRVLTCKLLTWRTRNGGSLS